MISEALNTISAHILANIPLIMGWACALLIALYKEQQIRRQRKNIDKLMDLNQTQSETNAEINATNAKITQQRREMLKQLKQEREQKGFYKSQMENALKKIKSAA